MSALIRRVVNHPVAVFSLPLALFLISAALGVWTAYEPSAATSKFWLIVIGVSAFYAVACVPERIGRIEPVRLIFAALPVAVGVWFLLINDWRAPDNETEWVHRLFPTISDVLPVVHGYRLHANTLGGIMAVFIPLQAAACFRVVDSSARRVWYGLGVVCLSFSIVMLVVSHSHGAGLALASVTAAWLLRKGYARFGGRWSLILTIVTVLIVIAIGVAIMGPRLLVSRVDRLEVWRNSFDLAGDYLFTGLGLDNFVMPYSSYVLLVHVEHTFHAHNLFLDVWLGQGALGLLALMMMFMVALNRRDTNASWRVAAVASLTVLLLHGMVDDAFYGYFGGKAVVLMFLPFSLLFRSELQSDAQSRRVWTTIGVAGASILLVIALAAFLPSVQAAFWRNVGALAQTKAELSAYQRHREGNMQDSIRVMPEVDLSPAIAAYYRALSLNPADANANRRLGQVELTFRKYEDANRRLLQAYAAAPHQRATRQLLGESFAVLGRVDEAVQLWHTVDLSQNQLGTRIWWYRVFTEQEERAGWIAQAISALDNE